MSSLPGRRSSAKRPNISRLNRKVTPSVVASRRVWASARDARVRQCRLASSANKERHRLLWKRRPPPMDMVVAQGERDSE